MNNPLRTPEDYELFLYTLTTSIFLLTLSTIAFRRPT